MPLTKAAPAALKRAGVADRRAGAVVVAAGERRLDVVLVARGEAEADDIDQQILAFAAHGGGQLAGVEGDDARGELFGNGNFGEIAIHEVIQLQRRGAHCRGRAKYWPAPRC